MQRKERLLEIIQILRDGQVHRAQDLALRLSVSTRTIWRDMEVLMTSGVPLEGARGSGYRLSEATSLPPLTLSAQELQALTLGLAVVEQAGDAALRSAARTLSEKIEAVLPLRGIAEADAWKAAISPFGDATRTLAHMPLVRAAIKARQKLSITATSPTGAVTRRLIRPLQLDPWGKVWTLTAWCETQGGFEVFRLDLIETAEAQPELFVDEPGKRIEDYVP